MAVTLNFLANATLGIFLVVLSILIARGSPDRAAARWLALFFALVGVNYAIDGLVHSPAGGDLPTLASALAVLTNELDPGAFVLFALALVQGPKLRTRTMLLVAAPPVALAAAHLALAGFNGSFQAAGLGPLHTAELALYYVGGFALLARAYLRETSTLQRDRLGLLVVALGVVVIPRPLLAFTDWGYHRTWSGPWSPILAAALILIALALVITLRRAALPAARPHVERTTRALGGLLVVVASLWFLISVPSVSRAAFSVLYSARWFLFGAVFATGVRHYELLRLPDRAEKGIRAALLVAAGAVGVSELAVVLGGIPGLEATDALLASAAVFGVSGALVLALRDASPRAVGELPWRRLAAYRAHVEIGRSDDELATLRAELGVSEREARDVARIVAAERAAVTTLPVEFAEGELALGRYRIERFLGAGTFGRVFAARDEVANERVVLKEISPAWRNDAEALDAFRREAEVALRVHHPNLVSFRSIERAADGHVLVLEFVDGETLRARLARGPLTSDEAARVGRDVAAALGALHARGILHRDVKPDNIVLRPDGRATLLDFGAALDLRGGTAPAAHPGTRGYMAPEQAAGARLHATCDVYALGATLREALGARVPDAWRACLDRALAHDAAERWPTAEAFALQMPQQSYVRAA